jgi:thiol-disulfide isomerase/thioredoxin
MKKLLLLSLLTLGLVSGSALRAAPVPPTPAPDWKLKDVEGHEVTSAMLKGKVAIVDFWATWCGPCRMEIPGYVELQKKYGKDRLVVVGMSVDAQGPGVVKTFIAKNQINYQIVMANDDVVAAFGGAEGIQAIPTTFIIDREGQIRDKKVGAESTESFEKRLAKFLE